MSSTLLEQAFGSPNPDLYEDVLKCKKECTLAQLRKAYYQQALKYHPDKNPDGDEIAKLKFQAVSWVYNMLKDPEKRADYDAEGIIPFDDDDMDEDEEKKPNSWKNYFDLIFGKLSTDKIDKFAMKYKMSEEEEKDVLENYEKFKGNLVKMLEYVMLSTERDVPRWVEDYLRPAIEEGKVTDYSKKMNSTLEKIQKKIEKEAKEQQQEDEEESDAKPVAKDEDETETETEDSSNGGDSPPKQKAATAKKASAKKAPPPKKGKPTKAKRKKVTKKQESSSQDDLIAMIRNKKRGNPLAALGARYGVAMDDSDGDDDPLNDAEFAKIQAKLTKKKRK